MSLLSTSDKVFVAGHRGLVGSALVEVLLSKGCDRIVTRTRAELDFCDQHQVANFFAEERPDVVFIAAAKVGGIHANNTYRADFIYDNLQIQNNLVWSAHRYGVHRLVFLGSSCIYPRNAPQPIHETSLLSGPLEYTNRPYAIAKIAGLELVHSLRLQYGRDYFSVMPTNLFGPRDNFHPENSHVLPAMVRRFVEARDKSVEEVVIWGSGTPFREFMFAGDCAQAIVHLAQTLSKDRLDESVVGDATWSHINIGSGDEISIADLAKLIAEVTGFKGRILFDRSKPDGTPRKLLDTAFLRNAGWRPSHTFRERLEQTVAWYEEYRQSSERVTTVMPRNRHERFANRT